MCNDDGARHAVGAQEKYGPYHCPQNPRVVNTPITLELVTPVPRPSPKKLSKAKSPMHHTEHCLAICDWRKLEVMFVQRPDQAIKDAGPHAGVSDES